MFEAFDTAYALAGRSYRVLCKDPELLTYPILSLVFSVVGWVATYEVLAQCHLEPQGGTADAPLLFVFYLVTACIAGFWDVALLCAARERLRGGDPTFRSGISAACRHLGAVFVWSIFSSSVGVVTTLLQEQSKKSRMLGHLVDEVWSVVTYFALPIMIFENVGPTKAVTRSKEVVRQTWGDAILGDIGLSSLYQVFVLPAAILGFALYALAGPEHHRMVLALAVPYCLLAVVYLSALEQVYRAGIYLQAVEGKPLPRGWDGCGFSPATAMDQPFPKAKTGPLCARCCDPMSATLVGEVEVDLCGRCGGLWLDTGEAEHLLRMRPVPPALCQPAAREDVEFRKQGFRECPLCERPLKVTDVEGVPLDGCPQCGGLFLDPGELGQLIDRL